jgi:hypothetical protein
MDKQIVKELFDYCDGKLIRKVKTSNRVKVGDIAGTIHPSGYVHIRVNGHLYKAHRLIFLWHHGYIPKYIDHIDRNKSNNKIENLRCATASENVYNTDVRKNNTTGLKGVYWHQPTSKWRVKASINGKQKHIGLFDSKESAYSAYCDVVKKNYGEFSNV